MSKAILELEKRCKDLELKTAWLKLKPGSKELEIEHWHVTKVADELGFIWVYVKNEKDEEFVLVSQELDVPMKKAVELLEEKIKALECNSIADARIEKICIGTADDLCFEYTFSLYFTSGLKDEEIKAGMDALAEVEAAKRIPRIKRELALWIQCVVNK